MMSHEVCAEEGCNGVSSSRAYTQVYTFRVCTTQQQVTAVLLLVEHIMRYE